MVVDAEDSRRVACWMLISITTHGSLAPVWYRDSRTLKGRQIPGATRR